MTKHSAKGPVGASPRLILFGVTKLEDMLQKGNVGYIDHYQSYFNSVDVVYLLGRARSRSTPAGTNLVSLGSGNTVLDLVLAPVRLYLYARRNPADVYLTADQVFSWWTALLIGLLMRARIVLMPVALPKQLYLDHSQSLSGMPVPLEKLMLRLSFRMASIVYTAKAFGAFVDIFKADPEARDKLLVTAGIAEALPGPEFLTALARQPRRNPAELSDPVRLIYVGRLHSEKLVEDVLRMMQRLAERTDLPKLRLRLIGDGPDRARLEDLAAELGVETITEFVGALTNASIPAELAAADILVSPLTGTSLREAALSGLPIVAYARDWVIGVLEDERTALMVTSRDVEGLAEAVARLIRDNDLRVRISTNVIALGEELWTIEGGRQGLAELHAAAASIQ